MFTIFIGFILHSTIGQTPTMTQGDRPGTAPDFARCAADAGLGRGPRGARHRPGRRRTPRGPRGRLHRWREELQPGGAG